MEIYAGSIADPDERLAILIENLVGSEEQHFVQDPGRGCRHSHRDRGTPGARCAGTIS